MNSKITILLFLQIYCCVSFAENEHAKVISKSYVTNQSDLLLKEQDNRYDRYSFIELPDTTYLAYPRDYILNNEWCISNSTSTPNCITKIESEDTTIILDYKKTKIIINNNIDESPKSMYWRYYDPKLLAFFEKSKSLKSIEIQRFEKTDREWAIFSGILYAPIIVVASMLGEFEFKNINKSRYNYMHVGLTSAIVTLGLTGYLYVSYDENPKEYQIKIIIHK